MFFLHIHYGTDLRHYPLNEQNTKAAFVWTFALHRSEYMRQFNQNLKGSLTKDVTFISHIDVFCVMLKCIIIVKSLCLQSLSERDNEVLESVQLSAARIVSGAKKGAGDMPPCLDDELLSESKTSFKSTTGSE